MSSKPKYKEAQTPQVSANQLAQYLQAGPSARKRIVQAARWQSTAIVARYRHAREAITDCLCEDIRSPATVGKARAKLVERLSNAGNSSWTNDDLESSIQALDRYASSVGQSMLGKVRCEPITRSVPPLIISELRVKVTPDAVLHRAMPGSEPDQIGALVAMIAKGESATKARKEQARTAALLVWRFAQKHLAKLGTPERSLCVSYDVFVGSVVAPSANYVSKWQNIEDACDEIMDKWHKASPPDDFDG
jgi:hypothetical protein